MNDFSSIPVFGEFLPGERYVRRPGAYAVIRDAHDKIAVIQAGASFFLPGGGSNPGETPEATLYREIMEECGRYTEIGPELAKAKEYLYASIEGVYYEIFSTFFTAQFLQGEIRPAEAGHRLVWLSAPDAIRLLRRQSQSWAVQLLFSSGKSS